MIRKFLICGKQPFLSSKRLEVADKSRVCELLLPLEVFWEIEKLLKKIDYSVATNEDSVIITDLYNQLLRRVTQYAISEKDRNWIFERLNGQQN